MILQMNKQILTGVVMCLLLATSSCLNTTHEDELNGTDFPPPLMGWSSWNTYHVNINEELIKKQADALVAQGLKDGIYISNYTKSCFFLAFNVKNYYICNVIKVIGLCLIVDLKH